MGASDQGMAVSGVQKGWSVYGADGKKLGDIDEVYPTYFKLRTGLIFKKDVFVPAAAVRQLRGNEVHLTVPHDEVDALGWDTAPFATGGRATGEWATVRRIAPEAAVAPLIERVFSREALRIPIRAEQVEVAKTPVITGEVTITKDQTVERESVEVPLRRTEVEVVEHIVEGERGIARRAGGEYTGRTEG